MRAEMERLLGSEAFQRAASFIERDSENTIRQQIELTCIPAFSNQEGEKSRRFKELVEKEGYLAEQDEVGNVYTRIPGCGEGPTLYVTAHLDTVFPMDTPLEPYWEGSRIYCPGIADDTRGCAEILALLRALRELGTRPVGNLILGANVGEEGLGDLRGMRHFFQRQGDEVDGFFSIDGAGGRLYLRRHGEHPLQGYLPGAGGPLLRGLWLCEPHPRHGPGHRVYRGAPGPRRAQDHL